MTYDKAVHKIVVTVSDEAADGSKTGYLSAKVSYEGDANLPPVFTNSYAEEPGPPRHLGESLARRAAVRAAVPIAAPATAPAAAVHGRHARHRRPQPAGDGTGAMAGIGALAVAGGAALYRRRSLAICTSGADPSDGSPHLPCWAGAGKIYRAPSAFDGFDDDMSESGQVRKQP
ncbi:MAG: Spy0128 family protein [Collinsella sp.]